MERQLNIIEDCFLRENKKCGRVLNGSKTAFIATPAANYVQLELEIIKSKLKSFEIAPYVAVEYRAFGKDVFCEKICGKIIESLFCIVVLNDRVEDIATESISMPNPNVYYEYGMMTTLNKKIIPLQKEKQKLAFNIQSLDTIKYNESNFASEIENAIKSIFVETEQIEERQIGAFPQELNVYLGLNGIVWPQIVQGSDFETAMMVGSAFDFIFLADFLNYQTCYIRIIKDDDDEKEVHVHVRAVQKRLVSLVSNIIRHIDSAEGTEYVEGKRVVNKALIIDHETEKQIKINKGYLRFFGSSKIIIYREMFKDKDSILEAVNKFEHKLLRSEIVLIDKAKILSFIQSEVQ